MPVSADGEGDARLRVRVTPRAKQSALAGLAEVDGRPALAIRLVAPPGLEPGPSCEGQILSPSIVVLSS